MSTNEAKDIGRGFISAFQQHDLTGSAAELAYRFLFAIFPFGLFVAALAAFVAGWLGMSNPGEQIVQGLGDNLPPEVASSVAPELQNVIGTTRPALLSVGAIAALWAANSGTSALIKAMNRAYEVEESRSFLHRLLLGVGLTLFGSAAVIVSFVTIVGGAILTEEVAEQLGLTGALWQVVTLARWPVVFLILLVALGTVFRFGPNVRVPWRWALAGSALFAIGWLVGTWAFAFYVGNFSNYGATYGSLAGVIILMLWFYLTGLLLVAAAALIASAAHVLEPESIQQRREEIAAARDLRAAGREVASRVRDALPGDHSGEADEGPAAHDGEPAAPDRRRGMPDRRNGADDRRVAGLHHQRQGHQGSAAHG
jgi:membrane protein